MFPPGATKQGVLIRFSAAAKGSSVPGTSYNGVNSTGWTVTAEGQFAMMIQRTWSAFSETSGVETCADTASPFIPNNCAGTHISIILTSKLPQMEFIFFS
jgi:hypothetical protein